MRRSDADEVERGREVGDLGGLHVGALQQRRHVSAHEREQARAIGFEQLLLEAFLVQARSGIELLEVLLDVVDEDPVLAEAARAALASCLEHEGCKGGEVEGLGLRSAAAVVLLLEQREASQQRLGGEAPRVVPSRWARAWSAWSWA
jgi:hypothetical protein